MLDPNCSQQICFSTNTHTVDLKQSTALQNIQQRPFLIHLAAMTVVGLMDYMNTHTHTHVVFYYTLIMLQICKVGFVQAIRTLFFISNKQKYTRSTHAVESMYSNIKNKQTHTYMNFLKNHTVP